MPSSRARRVRLVARFVLLASLLLCVAGPAPVRADDAPGDAPGAAPSRWFGLEPLDATDAWDRSPAHLERLSGLGRVLVRSAPLAWGEIEPVPPRGAPPRYVWEALDEAVLHWQLADLDPVLVLTPESPWAGAKRESAAWLKTIREGLPKDQIPVAERSATGLVPLREDTWPAWERFVRDVVERYDGDGKADMPGLRHAVRHIQVHDRVADPAAWIGSAEDYLRLLHHAGLGAQRASKTCRIVATSVDLRGTGYAPHPDAKEWQWRIDQLAPKQAFLARLRVERAFSLVRRLLESPRLYDVLPQRGAGSLVDDIANVGFLRRHLDAHKGADVGVWLVDNAPRKLGEAEAPGQVAPRKDEKRLRQRWLPVALNPKHSDHAKARAWLRRGQAFDVVRSLAHARVAGAEAVLFLAPDDDLPESWPDRRNRTDLGFVALASDGASGDLVRRTPSWFLARQTLRLLAGHDKVEKVQLGAPGHSVVFRFPKRETRPWVAVLLMDGRWSWAGAPGEPLPERDVLVAVPNGRYVVESAQLDANEPKRRTVRVTDGSLLVKLGPAPLFVIPQ